MSDDDIIISRGKAIIIVCLIGILFVITIYATSRPIPANINFGCIANPIPKNNVQPTHTYTESISNRDTLTCIKADNHGGLSGSSMQPTFYTGNTALTKNYTNDTILSEGDLVRFTHGPCGIPINNSEATIHRINAVYDNYIMVQGDNTPELESIQRCQITSIVVGIIFT